MAKYLTKRVLIERIYDNLYHQAREVLEEFNPCQHQNIDKKYSCAAMRSGDENGYPNSPIPTGCCGGCKHLTKNGCSADKPLTCSTWLCGYAALKNPKVKEKLTAIAAKASCFSFYVIRGDKNSSIESFFKRHVFTHKSMRMTNKEIIQEAKYLEIPLTNLA